VALSSTEAEFIAASNATQEVVWMRLLLKDMGYYQKGPTKLFEDNQSCIKFIENEKASARIKHLDVRRCHIKEIIKQNEIRLQYCPTEDNQADILTKPVPGVRFTKLNTRLGLHYG